MTEPTATPPTPCDRLGVCQARMPACNGCTIQCIPDVNADRSPTELDGLVEDIAAWAVIAAMGLATLAVVAGVAGYLWGA